jgi:hypothetical protein
MPQACIWQWKSFFGFLFSFVQPAFSYLALADTHFNSRDEHSQETGYHNDDTKRIIAVLAA